MILLGIKCSDSIKQRINYLPVSELQIFVDVGCGQKIYKSSERDLSNDHTLSISAKKKCSSDSNFSLKLKY